MKPITPIEIIRRRFASADFPGSAPDTTPEPCEEALPEPAKPVPAHIAALIAQRGRAVASAFRPIPLAGQIVRVPPRADDKGQAYAEYLAVLLDKEIAVGKWRAWLVGRDADYASEWDLVLGPEEEPCDPLCQIVQIWNPLTLPIQQADRVLAELSAERLQATRSLDHDFGNQLIPSPLEDHRIGVHLARELTDGTGVVTGTPLAPQGDPRREYQQLYREAALWISQQGIAAGAPARPTLPIQHPETLWDRLKASFSLGGPWLRPAAALAVLVVVPLLVVGVWRNEPAPAPVNQDTYIAGDGQQQLQATDPAATAREIESQLRTLGVQPEILFESGGTVVVKANLARLPDAERAQWLARHRLADPASKHLRLLIVATSSPAGTRP
jgi:hypothetical protein